jgi:splicing suppressor protein 51
MASSPSRKDATDYYTAAQITSIWDRDWFATFQKGLWCSGTDKVAAISPQFDCYHPYVCNVCKRGPITNNTPVVSCSQCKVVRYCSKDHQKHDWKVHKDWCKAFVQTRRTMGLDNVSIPKCPDKITWVRSSLFFSEIIRRSVKKLGLHTAMHQMVGMQPRCRRCFATAADGTTKLVVCPRCNGVAVCEECETKYSPERKVDMFHPASGNPGGINECDGHLLALCCTGMVVEQGDPLMMVSDTNLEARLQPRDWVHYFSSKGNDFKNTELLDILLQIGLAPVFSFVTDALSLPLTAYHVLSLPELEISNPSRLVLHIIGATMYEILGCKMFVELIRLNPHLEYLRLVFVGPQLPNDPSFPSEGKPLTELTGGWNTRPGCDAKVLFRKAFYHDALKTLDEQPSMILACHPGIVDPNYTSTWENTIRLIGDMNVPFVFTGYTHKEVLLDTETINKEFGGLNFIVPPTPNPFRGLRPFLDPMRDPGDFIFSNASFAVASKR